MPLMLGQDTTSESSSEMELLAVGRRVLMFVLAVSNALPKLMLYGALVRVVEAAVKSTMLACALLRLLCAVAMALIASGSAAALPAQVR